MVNITPYDNKLITFYLWFSSFMILSILEVGSSLNIVYEVWPCHGFNNESGTGGF